MSARVDVAAFPYHDWRKAQAEGSRWRDAHLIEELARHPGIGQVLVVDRPVSIAERVARRSGWHVRGDRIGTRRHGTTVAALTTVGPRITVLDIAVTDVLGPVRRGRGWWFSIFERDAVLDQVAWAADRILGRDRGAIAWTPTVAPAIDRIAPDRFVFDALDNWLIHPQLRRFAPQAEPGYAWLLRRADLAIASAPRSRDALERWNPSIRIIPNGVDPRVFALPAKRPSDLPAGPIVGYAGSLGPRVDAELVVEVAGQLPKCSFVFIGQTLDHSTVRRLASAPNVLLLGDRHYDLMPAYLQSFDIAWIPHAVGEGESGGDPIKLYEYWAAGREVVATPIDGLEQWSNAVHLVGNVAEIVRTIEGLLAGTVAPKHPVVPEDRTWASISDLLAHALMRR